MSSPGQGWRNVGLQLVPAVLVLGLTMVVGLVVVVADSVERSSLGDKTIAL